MFDVGGQRDERRKWIQCFNGETFCFDVSALLKRHVPPLLADLLLSSSHLFGCRSYVPLLLSPPPRRHCYHLRGGQQQLQHGYKGRQ